MRVTIIDTETTGMDPETNSIVEIAGVDLNTGYWIQSLVKPEHPISFGAMATHMITERMAATGWSLDDALHPEGKEGFYRDADVLVAHNAEFDRAMLKGLVPDPKWICTWRCAMHLYPEAESHRNMALAYELGLKIDDAPVLTDDPAASMPHRALFDAWVTRKLLLHMLYDCLHRHTDYTWSMCIRYLTKLSTAPVILTKVRFGKHEGQRWEDVPVSYLKWVVGQDFDEDTLHTAKHWLSEKGYNRG